MITTKLLQFANDKLDTEEMLFIQIGETSTPFPPLFFMSERDIENRHVGVGGA